MLKKLYQLFLYLFPLAAFSQSVNLYFPYLSGKTYDFIIFQGDHVIKASEGVIPENGKFTLTIPKEYIPYNGMSRWLITNSLEGGGLDMIISGHDFSVSCEAEKPNNQNIIYHNNTLVNELNHLHSRQQNIIARYNAVNQAVHAFDKTEANYIVFEKEKEQQIKDYQNFYNELEISPNYAKKILPIVNITQGLGKNLRDEGETNAKSIVSYITHDMDWKVLYTSGHWTTVISSWADIHSQIIQDLNQFLKDFKIITAKITDKVHYTDFVERIAHFLTQQGKDQYISMIAPEVILSGKVTEYKGSLAAYVKGRIGTQAPDLSLEQGMQSGKKINKKITDFFEGKDSKLLMIFYESGCGHCEDLLKEIPQVYPSLVKKGIKIISISADRDQGIFNEKNKSFLWNEKFREDNGLAGENFRNYGVAGTPTLILVDRTGKIILRTAQLKDVIEN